MLILCAKAKTTMLQRPETLQGIGQQICPGVVAEAGPAVPQDAGNNWADILAIIFFSSSRLKAAGLPLAISMLFDICIYLCFFIFQTRPRPSLSPRAQGLS
jgi:hypothetical protein